MPNEVKRELIDGKVHIFFDDETVQVLETPQAPPEGVLTDEEGITPEDAGHSFTAEQLKERGYND